MIDQQAIDLSEYRLEKAKDLLSQSELLLQNHKYDGSVNRSYYAIFNAMRSVLALVQLDSSRHSGVLSYFDQYFVRTAVFDKTLSKIAHLAFDSRQDSDYEDFYMPSEKDAQKQFENATRFINEIENKRAKLINQEIS